MLNTHQRQTKDGKPIVHKTFRTPLFDLPVHMRIKNLRRLLGIGDNKSPDEVWNSIKYDVGRLQCV